MAETDEPRYRIAFELTRQEKLRFQEMMGFALGNSKGLADTEILLTAHEAARFAQVAPAAADAASASADGDLAPAPIRGAIRGFRGCYDYGRR